MLHPELVSTWHRVSNHIVFLAARDEAALESIVQTLRHHDIKHKTFREPYFGDALTSVAIEPLLGGSQDVFVRDLVRRLPLALSRPPPSRSTSRPKTEHKSEQHTRE